MKKFSQDITDQDVDQLISKLMGSSVSSSELTPEPTQYVEGQYYQLPVRHTRGGIEIDDDNKPWVVGIFITDKYINKTHPQGHDGVDLKAPQGSPVYPIGPGVVIKTGTYPKGGLIVKVSHEDGKVVSYYAHLDSINVSVNQEVDFESVLGKIGDSGNARGRGHHLHYEIKVNNAKVDPNSITGKLVGSLSKKADLICKMIKSFDRYFGINRQSQLKTIIKDNNISHESKERNKPNSNRT